MKMGASTDFDVIVAGAGPAGSMAAGHLAQAGDRVLVLEKKAFPRRKPCGGCLSRRVENLLPPDLLRQAVEEEITRARFFFRFQDVFEVQTGQTAAYMVRRERFDSLLAREAERSGAVFSYGTPLTSFEVGENRVLIRTPKGSLAGRYLVLAQGAYPGLPGPLPETRNRLTYHALEGRTRPAAFRSPWPSRTVGILVGQVSAGYGWIFPCGEEVSLGLCFLPRREKKPRHSLEGFKTGLSAVIVPPGLKGHPLPCFDGHKRPYSSQRILWVGDAAHLIDPFLGEGIYYALLSGRAAAGVIHQALRDGSASLAAYDREIRRLILSDLSYALRLARWVYAAPRLFWWLLKKYPVIMEIYFDILRGQEGYERFFWEIRKRIRRLTGLQWILGEPRRASRP
jgi:geranylgeranyl reductase family protein